MKSIKFGGWPDGIVPIKTLADRNGSDTNTQATQPNLAIACDECAATGTVPDLIKYGATSDNLQVYCDVHHEPIHNELMHNLPIHDLSIHDKPIHHELATYHKPMHDDSIHHQQLTLAMMNKSVSYMRFSNNKPKGWLLENI